MANGNGMVTGVDFVCVPTQDFDRSVDFYENTLGLEKSKQWGNMPGQEFENGTVTIAVMQSDAFGLDFSPHSLPIAFQVGDVEEARKELESKGIEFAADTLDSGVCHMAHFRDPDGNVLMLHHRYAPKGVTPGDAADQATQDAVREAAEADRS
jgi:catechol 2,3-dioxygenase-like lactoylglutathione lyase family enzyme